MEVLPVELSRTTDGISIRWSNEKTLAYSHALLRKSCPCATCREKRSSESDQQGKIKLLPVLSLAEAQPVSVSKMRPVGNYAYNIAFSDGHDSGVFTFEFLLELGSEQALS